MEMKKLRSALLLLLTALAAESRAQEIRYAQIGQTVTLDPPEGIPENYYLEWRLNGREFAWTNHMGGRWVEKGMELSGSSLTVKDINENQFGIYMCNVSDKSRSYRVLRLTVSAQPSPLLHGQTVTLDCNAERPNDDLMPEIHWLNPQGEKMQQGRNEVKAERRHSGQWTCVVTHGQKSHTAQTSVTVIDLESPPSQYTSRSSPLSVPCSIPAQVPWAQIKTLGLREGHWQFFPRSTSNLLSSEAQRLFTLSLEEPVSWKPGQTRGLTPVSDLKNRNLSLVRERGDDGDRGDYVCTLKFDSGLTLNGTVRVNVLEISSAPAKDLISGQQLNLTCSLGVPLTSDLRLKWIPPQRSSLPPLQTRERLAIPAVAAGDGGKWRCELWRDDRLLTSAVITLKIEPRLNVWMLVIICSVAVIVLLLLLILGFVLCRRRREQKMRLIRHRLCQCENPKPKGFYRT